jgi:predicted DCC family thiol-disulfide oxidoreductase YuxK
MTATPDGMPGGPATNATVSAAATAKPIVFFDGECGLCDRTVSFILAHDSRRNLQLAPLQGETAAQRIPADDRRQLNSIVLLDPQGRSWRHSAAIVRLLWALGGAWSAAGWLLWLIPAPLRNAGYRFVARHRHRLFPKPPTCRMPTPEEREQLLP